MTRRPHASAVTEGCGNVFADLGLPEAPELLAKAHLASAISDLIEDRGLTQSDAARLLGTSQPSVSNLVNGRLEGFSLDRLTRFLTALGRDVEIRVRPSRSVEAGELRVEVG